ncbi:BTAD domain-containing putative transcriptional regulator [Streptomyces sp. NPDC059037]|uniref:AfsR/SARP family transcriptional regulator n=1 Tax=Streptomyces sp. NPDC059037 TaxID=3346710 RepID=UPI0036932F9C
MRFGVLGPLAVWTADGRPVVVPGLKTRALLADLLIHEGRPVSADRLIDDLWGEGEYPGNPSAALQSKIWQLRRVLEDAEPGGRELVRLQGNGYLLRTAPENVDAGRFAALTARAGAVDEPRARAALLSDALALWRGNAFTGFEDTGFARPAAARLEEARLSAVEAHAVARIELGEYGAVAGELAELVVEYPLREGLRAVQMRALYGAGRTSEALAGYRELRTRLAEEGLDPGPELDALQQAILRQDPALGTTRATARTATSTPVPTSAPAPVDRPRRPPTNLPAPVNELVGRQGAVAEVKSLFATARHLTLTGSGGVGKTRLALETAAQLSGDFPDGVWLVELASLSRTSTGTGTSTGTSTTDALPPVAEAVMTALGIRQEAPAPAGRPSSSADRLAEALSEKRLLLVLDNCEHVVDAVAELVSLLLRRAHGLRVLATSQESIGISGETVWTVPPLDVPGTPDETELAAVARSSAVQLFSARAAAAAPGFVLDADNARDVAVICRRLDGIPLALELAATRVRALGVPGLIARLDDRFRLLATGYRGAPPRQRTLRAMIDWSWELLTGPEQAVLRRLAVHGEGCTLEAAEAVCAGDGVPPQDVLDLLARLVDRSLVVMAGGGDTLRYRLLESVADYGLARLHEAGESERVRRRHRHYYTGLAELAAPRLHGRDQRRQLRLLDAEAANFRRALQDAADHDAADDALRLVDALTWYWFLRGRLREAGRSLDAALAVRRGEPATGPASQTSQVSQASLRAQVRAWRAGFAVLVGDGVDRTEWGPAAAALAEDVTDRRDGARARWFLGFALFGVGRQASSEELIEQALEGFCAVGDRWGIAAALSVRANQAHIRGDLGRLEHDGRQSAALFAELADGWGQLQTVEPLASLAQMTGDHPRAARLHQDGLRMAEDLGLWPEAADRLSGLGSTATLTGDHAAAREFHERAKRLAAEHSFKPGEIHAEVGLGLGARREGRLDAAEAHLRHVLQWLSRMAFEPGRALVLAELGFIAEQRGDAANALRLHRDGWAAARQTGDARALALALEGLAGAHALAGRPARAALLLGAAHAARHSVAMPLPAAERGDVDRITEAVRGSLDEDTYRAAWRRGRTMPPEEALP